MADNNIRLVKDDVKFWMVRTKQGYFFEEFIRNGYIAIGWNNINESRLRSTISKQQEQYLKEELRRIYDENRPGTALNKCRRFYKDIKPGDIVVIVGSKRVAIVEAGEYYEENENVYTTELEKSIHYDIEHSNTKGVFVKCPYLKRRKIEILKLLGEDDIVNPYLSVALSVNRHSLSDLSEHAELILSNCYEVFVYKNKLNLTVRVEQDKDINAMALSGFIYYSAKYLGNNGCGEVTVKTALHSPGDIILQIKDYIPDWSTLDVISAYFGVFGCKIGNVEFNSLLQIGKDIINRAHTKKLQELEVKAKEADIKLKDAEARKLDAETRKLEAETVLLEAEFKKLEEERKQRIENIEAYLPRIAECSDNLKVKQPLCIDYDKTKNEG